MPPFLKDLLVPVVEALLRLLFGRGSQPKQVTEETYAAKAAEAKELAKPDSDWSTTVDEL
ncbi:hypothetical protein [Limnoglobus roseus]|uniref:Uncharacterized protein n=1 Tax=Limnoglobus roseus TaxID=2598579 RepID=A0A5C1ACN8_9BACT|nr:hypothetical protein [Limnoglobus roseus]QEL14808.1 hypothetical protein PX52LOC_01705 [Limnoglobus roseus]